MLPEISRPPETPVFLTDTDLQVSSDDGSARFVPRTEPIFPPVSAFDIDNLTANNMMSTNTITHFIESDVESFDNSVEKVIHAIDDNEPIKVPE